ncbi:MAG: nitric oxide reductase activation protein NorD [Oscillospiraceae bacterium]|jgi:hypothetical protein|nr:nitric oxide reductase activation protein NorD [Oscillospiraceae bacterium]
MSVNHKKVKQLIAEKRRTVTDRQFFTSRIFAGYFEDLAAAQSRRYGHNRRVKVRVAWEPKTQNMACTNNMLIWINAGHKSVTRHRGRAARFNLLCGMFAHELGHVLYTDFLAGQTYGNKLAIGWWYPENPLLRNAVEQRHEADIWDFCGKDTLHLQAFCRIAHDLANILEDGYIDNKMITQYPGVLGQSLNALNRDMFKNAPTLTQMLEQEDGGESHIWCSITNLMLSYLLTGELKYGDEPTSDERVQVVFSLLPELDQSLLCSAKERLNIVNTILVRCWPYVKEFLEYCVEQSKKDGTGDPAGVVAGMMPGASAAADGDTTPVTEAPGEKPKMASPGKRTENAAREMERLLDQVAEENACEELEIVREKELNELANSLSYGNIHCGVQFYVHRMKSVDDTLKEQYQAIAPQLLHISKQLQRSILQQLKDQRRGGKQTGLLIGRRLDVHALPRNDGRVFCKNSLPTEAPQLTVALLLDESGSMSGERITYARAAAIILHDFCRALGIPVMVYGHSTCDNGVDLYSYTEFEAFDKDDGSRLMDVRARNSNRDGAALRYTAECLSRRPEEVKLLMLISDGQPADSGYYGTAAEEDLRGIQHEYQRKNVLFIAASIGDDRESLQRIYGDSYMDITDLTQLPVKLTQVVKRHIRV